MVSIISNDLDTDHITTTGYKNFISMHNNLLSLQTRLKDIYKLFDRISSENEDKDNSYKNIEGDEERTKKITFYDLIDTYGNIIEDNYKDAKELLDMLSIMLKITNTKLDYNRNKLSMFNIYLDIIMIGITVSSLIAAVFGMNIPNKLEDNDFAFFIVVISVVIIIVITIILTKFIQKMIIK
jgi:Mg2+ and Co2+ transporter CorA